MLNQLNRSFALRILAGTMGVAALFSLILSSITFFQTYREVRQVAEFNATQVLKVLQTAPSVQSADAKTSAALLAKLIADFEESTPDQRLAALTMLSPDRSIFATTTARKSLLHEISFKDAYGKLNASERSVDFSWEVRSLFVRVITPLSSQAGGPNHLITLTQIPPKKLATMFQNLKTLVLKFIIVSFLMGLATAQILYPFLAEQQRRIFGFAVELMNGNIESLKLLGNAIAKRDSDTNAHNFRVTIYAIRLAEKLELDPITIQDLIKGAFLHDVGKIGISDNILLKEGPLDKRERREMNKHVTYGTEIISVSEWLRGAEDVVRYHHEKFDGSGYPDGLSGHDIPINARIFAIVDVFDALTSKRPYKEPFSFERTWEILDEGAGNHFDPEILETFRPLSEEFYREIRDLDEMTLNSDLDKLIHVYFKP